MIRKRRRKTRDEWLEWRKPNVNASECPAVIGMDPYRTPLQLYYEKIGQVAVEETDPMKLGRWFEPAVFQAVKETYPEWNVIPQKHYYDDPDTRMGCSPDAFVITPCGDKFNLQAKVISEYSFFRWINWDQNYEDKEEAAKLAEPPLNYQIQTVVETHMTGCTGGMLAVVVLEQAKLYMFDVPRHDNTYAAIKEGTAEFWKGVESMTPPPINLDKDAGLIKKLYPQDDGRTIHLNGDPETMKLIAEEAKLADELAAYHLETKPIKKRREDIRTYLKSMIGEATVALLPGYKMTWKTYEQKAHTKRVLRIKALEED